MHASTTVPTTPQENDEGPREGVNPGDPGPPILEVPAESDPRTQAPVPDLPPPAV